jgi:uncharacterized membrane protein
MATTSTPPAQKPTAPHRRKVNLQPRRILNEKSGHHPVVLEEAERRAGSVQLRVADAITAFAGSMTFVYVHIVLFAAWMLFFEHSPWPTLTLVVSLEAIFLSTFVMIGQNRQSGFAQAKADHDFDHQEKELLTNTELTKEIHRLTVELHSRIVDGNDPKAP